jgi:lysophospholipase L1-like esterase
MLSLIRSWLGVLLALGVGCSSAVRAQGDNAAAVPVLRNLNAAQQAPFDAIDPRLTAEVTTARTALLSAALSETATASDRERAARALAGAESALALARADTVARLQATPERLGAAQRTSLAAALGRGGRGGVVTAPVPRPAGRIPAGDARLHYMGRWDLKPEAAITVNSGTSLLLRFQGTTLKGIFQPTTAPSQVYVSIDGGEKVIHTVNATEIDLAPGGLAAGDHVVEIETKDVSQNANRWTPPLAAALVFVGFDLGAGEALAPEPALVGRWSPTALRMEFLGDSITQGVRAISMATDPSGTDGIRTYSYLTAAAFRAHVTQVGFGAQGLLRGGGGGVPAVGETFYFNYAGSLTDPLARAPDVVVINQGTNDGGASPSAFEPAYLALLTRVRRAYPQALIAAMRPFNGAQDAAIHAAVRRMRDPRVLYIDTDGWLELTNSPDYTEQPTGLHPSLSGHAKAAKRLTAALAAAGVPLPRTP